MATFVLIHGAFGTPAELAPVIPHLEALGHGAVAVDLPCTRANATYGDYCAAVVARLDGLVGPIVLVGHSAGGATIALAGLRAKVDRLVYVTAIVPEPGKSMFDMAGDDVEAAILEASQDDDDGCRSLKLELFAAGAPIEEQPALLEYLRATQRPQGWAVMGERWPGERLPEVPSSYVLTTDDSILPPAKQREFAARLGVTPIEIASDHEVFGLRPEELAVVLAGVVE